MIQMLKSKIHGARITGACVDYEGSFGIDKEIMDAVGILSFESVEIYNVTNGNRLRTYAIPLEAGSRRMESNGAAAHLMRKGDRVIIASFHFLNEIQLSQFNGPLIGLIDFSSNDIKRIYQPDWKKADGSKPLTEFDLIEHSFRTIA